MKKWMQSNQTINSVDFYQDMFLIRTFEQGLLDLFSQGKLFGTVHTCLGQESDAVGVVGALQKEDIVFSNHRGHGHYLMKTRDLDGLLAEVMGKETGICGGRGGSQHLCNREYNFYSNGIQGGIVPNAVGMALAEKTKKSDVIVTVFLGDGTLGEGAVYESLNLASLWALPVLFVISNNQYAQSTPVSLGVAGNIADRPRAFGIAVSELKVKNPEDVRTTAIHAIDEVRHNQQPYALVLQTYRLGPHSKGDDTRDPEEIEQHKALDPLLCLRATLDEKTIQTVETQCRQKITQAIQKADQAPFPEHR